MTVPQTMDDFDDLSRAAEWEPLEKTCYIILLIQILTIILPAVNSHAILLYMWVVMDSLLVTVKSLTMKDHQGQFQGQTQDYQEDQVGRGHLEMKDPTRTVEEVEPLQILDMEELL